MEYQLIGVQDLNFDTKEGNKIDGISIWVGFSADNVAGYKTEKKFIQRTNADKMKVTLMSLTQAVGKKIMMYCDLKGNIVMMQLPQPKQM